MRKSAIEHQPGIIQRKLQRAYQEKELLLNEVQTLRQQLRQLKSKSPCVDIPADSIEGWNHLLEANMKSGTLSCLWCMKTYYLRMMAGAFGKWKCYSACAYAVSKARLNLTGMSPSSKIVRDDTDDSRRQEICRFDFGCDFLYHSTILWH